MLDGGEDLFELLVGCGEFVAADVEEFLAALGVGGKVVDAALRVLHLLYQLFEFGHSLGIGHFFHIYQSLVSPRHKGLRPMRHGVNYTSRPSALCRFRPALHFSFLILLIDGGGGGVVGELDGDVVTMVELAGGGDAFVACPHEGIAASQGVDGRQQGCLVG